MKTPYLIAAAGAVTLAVGACNSGVGDLKAESAQAATTARTARSFANSRWEPTSLATLVAG
jgi:hypothetical protein